MLKGPASLLYGIMDPGGIINTISKRPELYQHGSVTLLGSAYANSKTGADGPIDITGPIGDRGLAYRFIGYGVSEDYWRNFGRHREMLVAPSLAWYGENTTIQLNYEHREFIYTVRPRHRIRQQRAAGDPQDAAARRAIQQHVGHIRPDPGLGRAPVERELEAVRRLQLQHRNVQRQPAPASPASTAKTGIEKRSSDGTWVCSAVCAMAL